MPLPKDTTAEAIEAEIRLVEKMTLEELRGQWSTHWGAPPRFRSVDLLRRLIAWRLQAEVVSVERQPVSGQAQFPQPQHGLSP